jgi:hypothetical protein
MIAIPRPDPRANRIATTEKGGIRTLPSKFRSRYKKTIGKSRINNDRA